MATDKREGNLDAPTRHPLGQDDPAFYDENALLAEMERVFNICHGCRRCVSLCHAFPTLFDLVDESATMEVDGVAKADFAKVVDHCYLCDLCYMTKCPYVPPHPWNVDFPHLMLRAKAVRYKQGKVRLRDRILTSTDTVGNLAGIPVVAGLVNAANRYRPARQALQQVLGVHADAQLPRYHSRTLQKRMRGHVTIDSAKPAGGTRGRIALFATCYMNRNEPGPGEDFFAVFEHNGIPVVLAGQERCCGMPRLELGDLDSIRKARDHNVPMLSELVDQGWDLTALIPSCVLMFKNELPLIFPDDELVKKVAAAFYDPFEYLMLRHKAGLLHTDFKAPLGKVAYHAACHQRVQNIGHKTFDLLSLVPGTTVELIERCSGHDGTYAVKTETFPNAMKLVKPVAERVKRAESDHYGSDCVMAGHHIEHAVADGREAEHPITLLRRAYGL
ncbi:heterodisulfide reductase-related iron-sulfur binding cluster [Crenobacter sp. SG2303]|uniref:Heterodisulfide reductase-related iron-sulfur binding cluster n=1 Tax=Crenobacter oryzisoli TaxID=3056844 RepID=A0ABT7XIM1_9NEIS|nr:heterodisulfide reductase-related iron-sulfur binding cluster [Crenobacter sp. SG2303]MDN0073419.1 heterodisulfide reductase-related iron-sulfur binding cluster [Crenobacter sp. SG2303]